MPVEEPERELVTEEGRTCHPSPLPIESGDTANLIDQLLEEQQRLTAVQRFSQLHDKKKISPASSTYRDLIPLSRPGENEQYAFEVNLDACSGCKACVTACHSLNGLDDDEAWRDVGVLFGGTVIEPVQQTVTTACHHCADPGCLNGCPVEAYEKDPATGIVRHLDDQCIGCQYCMLKCPYDVPKYSKKRGIVRKCDMCHQRLSVGEAPACVQACPTEAIKIRIVSRKEIESRSQGNDFLPDSPRPDYTQPSTLYRSERLLPSNMKGGDHHAVRPQHPHWPLILMLVFSQAGVGGFGVEACLSALGAMTENLKWGLLSSSFFLVMAGLTFSVFHLGQPWKAWRVFLGLRRSWLSREIVVFGAFASVAAFWVIWVGLGAPLEAPSVILRWLAILLGLAGVVCSIKIYEDTQRSFWRMSLTAFKFVGTLLMMGAALWFMMVFWLGGEVFFPAWTLIGLTAVKLTGEAFFLRHWRDRDWNADKQSSAIMLGPLRFATLLRFCFGIAGGLLIPFAVLGGWAFFFPLAITGFVLCLAGELAERYLFFSAVVPLKMPGGIAS